MITTMGVEEQVVAPIECRPAELQCRCWETVGGERGGDDRADVGGDRAGSAN